MVIVFPMGLNHKDVAEAYLHIPRDEVLTILGAGFVHFEIDSRCQQVVANVHGMSESLNMGPHKTDKRMLEKFIIGGQ